MLIFQTRLILRRFNKGSKTLSLVATHARDSLVVTTLALSPGPFFTSVLGEESETQERSELPFVALADQTTKTIAVLACPRLHVPRSTSSSQSSPTTTATASALYNSSPSSSGDGDEGESDAVRRLRLLSVRRCQDKVASLVTSSEASMLLDSDDEPVEDEERGVNTKQHLQLQPQQDNMERYRSQTHCFPYRHCWGSWETRRREFVACTASGAVWEFGLGAPVRISGV